MSVPITDDSANSRSRSRSDGPTTLRGHEGHSSQGREKVDPGKGQAQGQGQKYQASKAWWSVGEFLHQGLTHQSVGLSLGRNEEETWELGDSLSDLYHAVTQRQGSEQVARVQGQSRSQSSGALAAGGDDDMSQDIRRWLEEDTSNGYIRVFASDSDTHARLFPCTLSTSAQKICLQMGIPGNSLHVQLNGDVIRRMEPFDCPLAIQNKYLAGLGYSDIRYIQEAGPKEDLAYLVRFYAGKPLSDFTYSRNQLSTYAYVRKGKLLHQWTRRRCVISGTRLFIYREKGAEPTTVQLAKGSVEEVIVKGQSLVLKLTSTLQGERSLYMSFVSQDDYNKWLRKIRKATAKLPGKADLSNCHLEFLPETVFNNNELEILILRHNALRERPIEEDIYTIGWLDDLHRFTCLRSLNLADNQLAAFPVSLAGIRSLVELNLASNKLVEIPSEITQLVNLQVLHLHNNLLSYLPEELGQMKQLAVVVLAFNKFAHIPDFLLQSHVMQCKVDSVIMAGNQISRLPAEFLPDMGHIRKIDLRLNRLQLMPAEMARFQSLEHVTHLDIRENQVSDLDVRAMRELEYLNCERNSMKSMQLNGSSLKNIFASHNSLQTLSINPKPEWLVSMNLSHNKLTELPSWLPDCFFLVTLDVSHNSLKALPDRLFVDGRRLKVVKAHHNRLSLLPEKIKTETLEELYIQHNLLRQLPGELFLKATRLRQLNVTKNKLCDLPPPHSNPSYNKLQELYLSFNHLANRTLQKICCFPRLRVLHLAKNKLSLMDEIDIEKLEQLSELNVSSNSLTYLPSALGRHPKLQVLRANCNLLQELPNFKNSSALKVLEVSSNHLVNVDMTNLMASQVSLLDISANPSILVKSHDLELAKKRLCMLDMSGQNLSVEDLPSHEAGEDGGEQNWLTGLSLTSGIRNKLSVTSLNRPHYGEAGREALFAVFDGGRNDSVAKLLCDIIPETLRDERSKSKDPLVYLKYSLLSAHRNLKSKGQKLGASAVVAHLHKNDQGQNILSIANVGDSQAVLCRQRRAFPLSRSFTVAEDEEDTRRVVNTGGIVTEDGRVSGVTYNTRTLGCSYLYPQVIPDPHVTSVAITPDDTVLVIANQGLWQFVSYEEAIAEIKDTPDPMMAVKRLQDLAQGYGSRENIAVLVVRLMLSPEERSKAKDMIRVQRKAQKELLKVLSPQENLLQLRDGVPKVEELDGVVIDKYGHAKKGRTGSKKSLLSGDTVSSLSDRMSQRSSSEFISDRGSITSSTNSEQRSSPSSSISSGRHSPRPERGKRGADESRKLSHYRKKQEHSENLARKRMSEKVKAKEPHNDLLQSSDKERPGEDRKEAVSRGEEGGMRPGENDVAGAEDYSQQSDWAAKRSSRVRKADEPVDREEMLERRKTQEQTDKKIRKLAQGKASSDDSPDYTNCLEFLDDDSTWATKPSDDPMSYDTGFDESKVAAILSWTESNNLPNSSLAYGGLDDQKRSYVEEYLKKTGSNEDVEDFPMQEPLDEMNDEFEGDRMSVSPSESVSSIDLRLHNEADRIYSLRYLNPLNTNSGRELAGRPPPHPHKGRIVDEEVENIYPPPPSFTDDVHSGMEPTARPLSPDSLISQDEFVKPPISTANIDRDALLFHQMQMARAQAHSGSVASLDSVQSAPLNPTSSRNLLPQSRVSSHSIEVLVNIGEREEGVWTGEAGPGGSEVVRAGSRNSHKVALAGSARSIGSSTSTITGSKERSLDIDNEATTHFHTDAAFFGEQEADKRNTVKNEFDSKVTEVSLPRTSDTADINRDAVDQVEEHGDSYDEDDDDDRQTLVGDDEDLDIANLADVAEDENIAKATLAPSFPITKLTNLASTRQPVSMSPDKEKKSSHPQPPTNNDTELLSNKTTDTYDSDSDESIGNVSLGDGYSAMEFPTNVNRNGSVSMLNMLESEAEDYPELFPFRNSKNGAYIIESTAVRRHGGESQSRRKVSQRQNEHQKVSNSKPTTQSITSSKDTMDSAISKNESPEHHLLKKSNLRDQDYSMHLEDDYEDIDDFNDVTAVTLIDESQDDIPEDQDPYEAFEYSPVESKHEARSHATSSSQDQPAEEDIDALYTKVNKIKMQKINKTVQNKEEYSGGYLPVNDTAGSDSVVDDAKYKHNDPILSRSSDFAAEGLLLTVPVEEPDVSQKLPPRPPLPPKPLNVKQFLADIPRQKQKAANPQNNEKHNSTSKPFEEVVEKRGLNPKGEESIEHRNAPSSSQNPNTLKSTLAKSGSKTIPDQDSVVTQSKRPSPPPRTHSALHHHIAEKLSQYRQNNSSSPSTDSESSAMTSSSRNQHFFFGETAKTSPGFQKQSPQEGSVPPPLPPKEPYFHAKLQRLQHNPPPPPPSVGRHKQTEHDQVPPLGTQDQVRKDSHKQNHANQHHHLHHPQYEPAYRHRDSGAAQDRFYNPPEQKVSRSSKKSSRAPQPSTPPSPHHFSTSRVQSSNHHKSSPPPLPPPPVASSSSPSPPTASSTSQHRSRPQPLHNYLPPGGARVAFPHVEDTGDDDFDSSVLSAHEFYPSSHHPLSAPLPNSSTRFYRTPPNLPSDKEMAAANKLPVQRSIIITYL